MPRTKRPTKVTKRISKGNELQKRKSKAAIEQKNKLDTLTLLELRNLDLKFKLLMESIDSADLQKTVGQLRAENRFDEITITVTNAGSSNMRCAGSQDDGYITENSQNDSGTKNKKKFATPAPRGTGAGLGAGSARRSRSAEARGSRAAPRQRARSAYRTPGYNKSAAVNYPPITPKVTPQTPLTVLRQPRQGEMVVSMSGSPVIVPSCYTMQADDKANCNILLRDGTMLSLQPKQLRQSQAFIPFSLMDDKVLHQLKTLKDNIDMVVKMGKAAKW